MIKGKKWNTFNSWIFLFLWLHLVQADTVPPTFLQGCDALDYDRTIMCFGGTSGSVDVMKDFRPTSQFYSLDVSQPLSPNQAKENWKPVPAPANFELEPRAEFGHAMVNATKWFITSGAGSGTNYTQATLVNNTLFYDMKANQWRTYTPSNIKKNMNAHQNPVSDQLLGVSICSQYNNVTHETPGLFATGGMSLTNFTKFDTNTSAYTIAMSLDDSWNSVSIEGLEVPGRFLRSFREMCAFTDRFRIFVFGGFAYNTTTDAPYYTGVDNALSASPFERKGFFDIQANTNNISTLPEASYVPTDRYWHSLTPIPKIGKIFMFGGVFNKEVSRDYCVIFDIEVRTWTLCDFGNSTNIPGPRYGHSAVLVGEHTLYILFGADANHKILNDVQILNITSMRWLDPIANSTVIGAPSQDNSTHDSSPSLSPGQIAGVVIGVVAGVSLLIVGAVIYFCMWKKKKNAEQMDILPAPAFLSASDNHSAQKVLTTDQPPTGTRVVQNGNSVKPSELDVRTIKPAESVNTNAIKPSEEKT